MSDRTVPSEKVETNLPAVTEANSNAQKQVISKDEIVEFLREIQENAGQISELTMEENMLVKEFFEAMLKILTPFAKNVEISVSSLPEEIRGKVSQARLDSTGYLALMYDDGKLELLNLYEQENRDVLVEISGVLLMKLRDVVNSYRKRVEKRVKFLSSITGELQKVAKVFSSTEAPQS